MVKKGKNFSGKATPLFESKLVQPTKDEGEASKRQSEPQPTPSPPHPKGSGGNHGYQAKEIKHLKAQIKKLKKKANYKAWIKSVSMKQRLAGKKSLKKNWMKKESVSKQGRKPAKSEPTVHKDPAFDDLGDIVDDVMDYMESEDAQDEERTSSVVLEEKESADKEVSTEAPVSIVKPNKGTDKRNEGTDKQDGSTDSTKVSTDRQGEGTAD
ncbi:hypothetical protein Tco_1528430, partial [Tanacetum coccineum]